MASAKWRPFCLGLNVLIPPWISNYIHYEARDEYIIHSQNSTLQLLKFENE